MAWCGQPLRQPVGLDDQPARPVIDVTRLNNDRDALEDVAGSKEEGGKPTTHGSPSCWAERMS